MFNFNDKNTDKTMASGKGAFLLALIFIGLLLWHVSASAEYMAHWANFRYADGTLIGTVSAGDYIEVLGQAEDAYRSYVYVPSYGMYGYICTVYIYGGTDWEYDNPFSYGGGYSGYQESYSYQDENYSYDAYTYSCPEEDYVYRYSDSYYSPYDSYYDTYGGYSDTWVEVDISDQTARLWDGRDVVAEDYCVTGTAGKTPTPEGNFYIYSKTRDEVLRGYNSDGSPYAAHVDYWMPFCGGVGLHDATWRGAFGGDIYRTRNTGLRKSMKSTVSGWKRIFLTATKLFWTGWTNMLEKDVLCKHIISVGERAVYVAPECKGNTHTIKGRLVVAAQECERCRHEMALEAELKDAQRENDKLRKRLAAAVEALDESKEKTCALTSAPPAPRVDIRGGIKRWMIGCVSTTKGIGDATISKLRHVLDGTSDAELETMFKEDFDELMF